MHAGFADREQAMNWEAVSAITEVAGLIAIIASLIYIGAQSKQANDHATAASETAWIESLNQILDRWVHDEHTASVLRQGFGSFNGLPKPDQAIFQMRVGSLVNHWLLANQLSEKGLLAPRISAEMHELVIAALSTPGGLEYWEYDSKTTPDGVELLETVKERQGKQPTWIELMPWWGPD